MAGTAQSVLTASTLTLVLLALQGVSDFMPGAAGLVLTAFTSTLACLG